MNLSQEKVLYHLTGQTEAAGLADIQQIAEAYPYFAPAQSLLAYKYRNEEHPMVVLQTLRTALYFTNPYWLQYQLQDDGIKRAKWEPPVKPSEQPVPEQTAAPVLEAVPVIQPQHNEPVEAVLEHQPDNMSIAESYHAEPILIPVPEELPAVVPDAFPEAEPPVIQPSVAFTADVAIPTVEAVKEMMRRIDPADKPEEASDADETDETAADPGDTIGVEAGSKISSLLSEQFSEFKKPLDADAKLDLEVTHDKKLHTIDYFASQGIKIDLNNIPQDKLTNHLRKFTDWLKQVKQGDLNTREMVSSIEMEQQVAQTALHSNESDEVITEAMAEVLEKQGQTERAIQVYEKLSFINPEKSSYFAAKIEHLKGI